MTLRATLFFILLTLGISAHSADNPSSSVSEPTESGKILRDQFDAGEYWLVGTDGLNYLKQYPADNELRIRVADSLAWTGRYSDAIVQYQKLSNTELSDRAALGLANVYRWSSRPDLAQALYQKVRATQPENPDAIDGMNRIDRELRPRTKFNYGKISDSNSVVQNSDELSHRWRGDDLALKYELSLNLNRISRLPLNASQKEIGLSIEHASMALAPRLDLSVQQSPASRAFGSLRLKLDDASELHVTIGYVNWGKMAFQPQALLDGLSAKQLGVDGSIITRPGTISAVYNAYRISDGNQIQDANMHFSPSWRPLGPDFRYYIGLSGRFALNNVPTYWSPKAGYLSTDIGFTQEWSLREGDFSIYGQRGFRAGGEALNSHNMGFAVKRYVDHDWAASLNAGLLANRRAGAYSSKYLTLGAERLW